MRKGTAQSHPSIICGRRLLSVPGLGGRIDFDYAGETGRCGNWQALLVQAREMKFEGFVDEVFYFFARIANGNHSR